MATELLPDELWQEIEPLLPPPPEPFALAMVTFSYRFFMEDSDVLKGLENKGDYGRVAATHGDTDGGYRRVQAAWNALMARLGYDRPSFAGGIGFADGVGVWLRRR